MSVLWVNGIVAARDMKPYVVISRDEHVVGQLTIAEARQFAMDVLQVSARAEADAMLHKFFTKEEFPREAGVELMKEFREFRAGLDGEDTGRRR